MRVFAEAHERAAEEASRMSQVQQHEAARRQLHGELLRLREAKVSAPRVVHATPSVLAGPRPIKHTRTF